MVCRNALAFFLVIFLVGSASAQNMSNETMVGKLEAYNRNNQADPLFLHLDKTIYTNNETIWFSAYVIRNAAEHKILSVALVKEDNAAVSRESKFMMENGLSFGNIVLPDSIPPGNYQLIATTDLLDHKGSPVAVFSQPITVKSIRDEDFKANFALLDTVPANGSIRAKISIDDFDPEQAAVLTYSVGKDFSKTVKLKESSSTIDIPASLLSNSRPVLYASLHYKKDVRYFNLNLPKTTINRADIRFFPEGGSLVNSLESTIGWEAKMQNGTPLALKGILYKNSRPIDTIITNESGIGMFRLKPEAGAVYSLKSESAGPEMIYYLPPVLADGVVLNLKDAVVNDTLRLSVSSQRPKKLRILVHNFREGFASAQPVARSLGTSITIPLSSVPKGLTAITVLDSADRPLAERLFFAHFDQKINTMITSPENTYQKRDSVHIVINITDGGGMPVGGIVSVSAVQDNRIEPAKQQEIDTYIYLNYDLGPLPRDPQGKIMDNKQYLEKVMLIKGWRRYTWQGLMRSDVSDTVSAHAPPTISGLVKYNGKPLKKSTQVIVMKTALTDIVATDQQGFFKLDTRNLVVHDGRPILLSVNEKNKAGYVIQINDGFVKTIHDAAGRIEISYAGPVQRFQTSSDFNLSGLDHAIDLKEVNIRSDKDGGSLYGAKRIPGPNACGDYVDHFGYLNYGPSAGELTNYSPVEGKEYRIRTDIDPAGTRGRFSVSRITYSGCLIKPLSGVFRLGGIYAEKEFYGIRKDETTLPDQLLQSTLFWRPGVVIGNDGKTQMSFYTGDIAGKFRIVVQGVTQSDVLFGENNFIVK